MAVTRKRTALDWFFGPWILRHLGVDYPERPTLEVIAGAGVTLTPSDDPTGDATQLTIAADGTATSVAVVDDIAKHDPTKIDTVQGIQGIPLKGYTRGTAPIVGATPVYHAYAPGGAGYEAKKPVPGGWYDVTSYGAKGDGTTDDADAIDRAIAAAGAGSSAPVGGVVYFPFSETGVGTYRCARNIHIDRQTHLRGAGYTEFYTQSCVKFDAGFGFIFDSAATDPVDSGGTSSEGSSVENLKLTSDDLTLALWQPSHAYVIGDKVRVANDNRYYFQCTVAGTSGTDRPFRDELDPVGILSNQGKELGVVTVDGSAQWVCKSASPITAYARIHVNHCYFYRAPNAGLMMFGDIAHNGTDVSSSSVRNCWFQECGVGLHLYGDDANAIHVDNVVVIGSGSHQFPSETGGFGFVDYSFLGCRFVSPYVDACTGDPFLGAPGKYAYGSIVGPYIEGGQPTSRWRGLFLGGVYGSSIGGDLSSPFATGFYSDFWHTIYVQQAGVSQKPQLRLDDTDGSFLKRFTTDDITNVAIAERCVVDTSGDRGYWMLSSYDGATLQHITGVSQQQAEEGPHQVVRVTGEFRGPSTARYYVAYGSKHDIYVRMGTFGVGGHYLVGDRYENPNGNPFEIGEVCIAEGWDTPTTWATNSQMHVWTEFYRTRPSSTVQPTSPNGYTYACTKTGTTNATTEPTWPTTMLGGVQGRYSPRWVASAVTRIGEYRRPSTPNGHYYKATATASYTATDGRGYPNAWGEGSTSSVEPTWPTGSGSTVTDGGIVWTEQGSDSGAFVTDGTTEWQCLGTTPVWRSYGTYAQSFGGKSTLDAGSPIVADTTTGNATPQIVASGSVADGECVTVKASVDAIKDDKTLGFAVALSATFRNNGGTLTQIGSTAGSPNADSGASTWAATISPSGTSWQLVVTGAASTNIRWSWSVVTQRVVY